MNDFQRHNRRITLQRLMWMRKQENGIVAHHKDAAEEFIVVKNGNMVLLHFVDTSDQTDKPAVSDVMSIMDASNPFLLHSTYAQALLMSLALIAKPMRMYMLGFGGGRLPMFLYHHLPGLEIDASELSEGVVSVLEMCFGVKPDERMRIAIKDGREHLQQFPPQHFDLIFLDTFSGGEGKHPNALSTIEFYQLCKSRLTPNGIVGTNLVDNSPYFQQKLHTFCASFKHAYVYKNEENYACLGMNSVVGLSPDSLLEKAVKADLKYNFHFKLADYAAHYHKLSCNPSVKLLSDDESEELQ